MKTYYHFYLKKFQKKLHVVFWLVGLLFISCTSADEYDSVDYINLPLVKFSDTSLKISTINYPDVPLTEVLDSGLGALKISGFLKTRIEIIDNKAKKYSFTCSPLTKNYSQTDINDNYH
ncbi:MAG: hypothetical protein FGM41_12905, partial [Bacteroidetes bacterium]|nr:hypothetical protein [Bacteroidota bacterium]